MYMNIYEQGENYFLLEIKLFNSDAVFISLCCADFCLMLNCFQCHSCTMNPCVLKKSVNFKIIFHCFSQTIAFSEDEWMTLIYDLCPFQQFFSDISGWWVSVEWDPIYN